jgi:hypothetical protein
MCWDLIPIKAARLFTKKGEALARSIIACEKYIKEAKGKTLVEVLGDEGKEEKKTNISSKVDTV